MTYVPGVGLNELAARIAAAHIEKVTAQLQREAKEQAPPTKVWITQADDRVRHTHAQTHGQEVPGNLRFEVPSMDWDMEHRGLGPTTYMRAPKDETSRAVANLLNCRCYAVENPEGIREHIHSTPVRVEGPRAVASVYAEGHDIQGCEFGQHYPDGNTAEGTHFMAHAAERTRARIRMEMP